MNSDAPRPPSGDEADFGRQVAAKAARKLSAQRRGPEGVWAGLGVSGLIGWSVSVPTVGGALLGLWWDRRHPGGHSWTLALLAAGLFIGCLNAWHWVFQQGKDIQDEPGDGDE
jgi:ATP synthase protein I